MLTRSDYNKAKQYGMTSQELKKLVYKYKATPAQIFTGAREGKGLNYIRMNAVRKGDEKYTLMLKRTGKEEPRSARIIVSKWYYDQTGGERGWETVTIYDRAFTDWHYAHLFYKRMLEEGELVEKR
ncbi:hypothetical protein GLV94_05230 [Virgibacillus halodenitrificans]|uniref:hypothetical protein n=1 Tax=Virgibacillus halodenitrificans TaxID=1482 RepID=UPI00136BDAA3|nr:hypothetical protein [Virgibacillus halodenitrificans]MYL45037.1 hypothetical protein [Virgibacillus halodenitrificans]